MANYAISGVWKDSNGTITHYAIHDANFTANSTDNPAKKYSKAEAITLLDNSINSAKSMLWNYSTHGWNWGTTIQVVGTGTNRYLRTTQDGTVRDNLDHLIDYSFVTMNLS